jgi:chorismate synthase
MGCRPRNGKMKAVVSPLQGFEIEEGMASETLETNENQNNTLANKVMGSNETGITIGGISKGQDL